MNATPITRKYPLLNINARASSSRAEAAAGIRMTTTTTTADIAMSVSRVRDAANIARTTPGADSAAVIMEAGSVSLS